MLIGLRRSMGGGDGLKRVRKKAWLPAGGPAERDATAGEVVRTGTASFIDSRGERA